MGPLSVAFVVQGEGRGHMTQALALASFLRDAGHEIGEVLVGCSPHRSIPDYFIEGMEAPVRRFEAPVQVAGADGRGMSVRRTVADTMRRSPSFLRSLVAIAERTADADVIVNLLDLMGGLSKTVFPTGVPTLAVAHNYVFLHPDLRDAPGPANIRRLVMAYVRATAAGSQRKVALSFTRMPPVPGLDLDIAPPLLRPGLDGLDVTTGDYLLAYALNPGYADRLAEWHGSRGEPDIHCYVEGGGDALSRPAAEGFHAHDLDDRAFLQQLAGCRAYVGTAGFESICEAHYLGKPVLAVPTHGQFEQQLNAWDAQRCGAARMGGYEDLDDFWSDPKQPAPERADAFRRWVRRAPEMFAKTVERVASTSPDRAENG